MAGNLQLFIVPFYASMLETRINPIVNVNVCSEFYAHIIVTCFSILAMDYKAITNCLKYYLWRI